MREVHKIQEELEQQYQKSGLSYLEWLQATEDEFQKSLAEDGFHMVTRNGEIFFEAIKPQTKRNKSKQTILKAASHKNYDDIEASTMSDLPLISEERAFSDKIEPPPKKKHVKYKTAAKRNKANPRKKSLL